MSSRAAEAEASNRDRRMTSQPTNIDAKAGSAAAKPAALLGIFDFSYQHYALGDLLTNQVNLAIMAIEQGLREIDIIVMVNPERPSARQQTFVTRTNYIAHLDNIMPAFACSPLLQSLQLVRDVQTFNFIVALHHRNQAPMWPDLKTHLKMQQDFPIDHRRINAFHARHGYVPQLSAPRGYESWARRFHATELRGRPLVVINPRQSTLTETPTVIYRDAPLPTWHAFIDEIGARRPDVLFVMVGGFQEWEHRLSYRRNVFIPRAWGLRLAHELALLKIADLFMGTSSGFATFATFTDVAYAIVNVEHNFARYAEIRLNDRHYPFAHSKQVLTWRQETTQELLGLFDELSSAMRTELAAGGGRPAAPVERGVPSRSAGTTGA
jgi:hypothetical protein